jgi:hypothetical protein
MARLIDKRPPQSRLVGAYRSFFYASSVHEPCFSPDKQYYIIYEIKVRIENLS